MPSVTVSMAGLPPTKAWVLVGPPLLAKVVLRMLTKAVGSVPLEVAVISVGPGVKPLRPDEPLKPKMLKLPISMSGPA